MGLEADRDDAVIRMAVRGDIGVRPGPEHRIGLARGKVRGRVAVSERRRDESRAYLFQLLLIDPGEGRAAGRELRLDLLAKGVEPVLVHGDLDPRLVLVVAPSDAVVGRDNKYKARIKITVHEH